MNPTLNQQDIITILGLESLPEERRAALVQKASTLVESRLAVRVMESLNPADQQAFQALLDTGTDAETAGFVAKKCPDLRAWAEAEALKLKQELAESAGPLD